MRSVCGESWELAKLCNKLWYGISQLCGIITSAPSQGRKITGSGTVFLLQLICRLSHHEKKAFLWFKVIFLGPKHPKSILFYLKIDQAAEHPWSIISNIIMVSLRLLRIFFTQWYHCNVSISLCYDIFPRSVRNESLVFVMWNPHKLAEMPV